MIGCDNYPDEIINAFLDFDRILCFMVLFILNDNFVSFCLQSNIFKGSFDAIIN